jgi:hypothetical protein
MRNKMEKFVAECPKCGMTYKGNAKYFRFDLKEKCFDGITKLVNYRIAGTKFDAVADKVASEMIANASKWHSDLVSGKIPLD